MPENDMTEERKAEIALAKARDFKDGDSKPHRAEMDWQEYLVDKQHEYNNAVMKEQHRLNKWVVIIAAVISALAGLFGGVIGGYTQYLLGKNQQRN